MKLISKIKDKCIKTLGGYTDEEFAFAKRIEVKYIDRTNSILVATEAFASTGKFLPPKEYLVKQAKEKLFNELVNDEHLVKIQEMCTEYEMESHLRIRAEIRVIPCSEYTD